MATPETYTKIDQTILARITAAVGPENVFTDSESLNTYSHDETEDLHYYPEVVVKPADTAGVSALLKVCHAHQVPVTPRGGGTGLSGAALPVFGGVLLSMERFRSILSIDTDNLQATVEPGVITEEFINAVDAQGLRYPVDPSSKGSCFIGGNVAHGSGGPRVVKYGTIREYILNLEVVLPTGEVIWTGANTLKYASGYNLTQKNKWHHKSPGAASAPGLLWCCLFALFAESRTHMRSEIVAGTHDLTVGTCAPDRNQISSC